MRKLLVIALMALTVGGTASIALAGTTLQWTGQGSENLPCNAQGGHWVLTGKGITSATATINGVNYVMKQSGMGSWSVDSLGRIGLNTTASVMYEGSANNPQFVLSHCNGTGGYGDPYAS